MAVKSHITHDKADKTFRFNKRPLFCQWCSTKGHRASDCPQLASLKDERDPVAGAQSSLKCQKVQNQVVTTMTGPY